MTNDKPQTREEFQALLDGSSESSGSSAPTFTAAKAIVGAGLAALTAGLGSLYTALSDGVMSPQETVGIALAVVGSLAAVGGGVYVTTNKIKEADHG